MKAALRLTVLGVAALAVSGLAGPAEAGYVVTLTQQGTDVVATGSGSLDLTGLTFLELNSPPPPGGEEARINASVGLVVLGPTSSTAINVYKGLTGPSSLGSGSFEDADSGSGSLVGVAGSLAPFPILGVLVGYVSGSPLGTSTDTWDHATFASLGVKPGVYEWTWGSGANQNFTLDAVPEPSTWAMMLLGFAGLCFAGYRARTLVSGRKCSAAIF
jgi:PEP-CTERM motif-containing protein